MSTGVAAKPSGEELNKQLKAAMRTIDRKLKAMGHLAADEKPVSFKTNGSFKINENDGNSINIFTYHDACYLGRALAKMMRVKKEYNEAMEEGWDSRHTQCACGTDILLRLGSMIWKSVPVNR